MLLGDLLALLAAHCATNGQTPRALAGVFGPLLLWPAAQAAAAGGGGQGRPAALCSPRRASLEDTVRLSPCNAWAWAADEKLGLLKGPAFISAPDACACYTAIIRRKHIEQHL